MMVLKRENLTFDEWKGLMAVHIGEGFKLSKPMRDRLVFLDLIDGASVPSLSARGRQLVQSGINEASENIRSHKPPMAWGR